MLSLRLSSVLARDGHTERGGYRGGGVSDSEGVVFALAPLREPGDPIFCPICRKSLPASRQDLVPIGLMADIPDELVYGCIEDVVERHGQLYHSQTRSEMAIADLGDDVDDVLAELCGYLWKVFEREFLAQVGWILYLGEERSGLIGLHRIGVPKIIPIFMPMQSYSFDSGGIYL